MMKIIDNINYSFMVKVLFLFIFLTHSTLIFSCDCGRLKSLTELRNLSRIKNELIFLGKVVKATDTSYTFKIIEQFKGKTYKHIVGKSITSCSILPSENELWLVYANMEGGYLNVSNCYFSMAVGKIANVTINSLNIITPPHPLSTTELDSSENRLFSIERNIRTLSKRIALLEELELLRTTNKLKQSFFDRNAIFLVLFSVLVNFVLLCVIFFNGKQF